MNIAHVASHNINVGDGALNSVIQSYLGEVDEIDVAFRAEPADLSVYDKVVVGGGGAISNNRLHNGPLEYELYADDIDKRFAFVGLGYNLFYGQEYEKADNLKRLVDKCNDLDVPFSVRMDESKERIYDEMGIDVEEIPDPGLFVEVDESYDPPEICKDRPNIIIQLAGDNAALRSKKSISLPDIATLIGVTGANIILAPHITRDLTVTGNFLGNYPYLRKNISVTGVYHPREASKYFKIYKDADLVIGMRGHAVICGVGLGTPTLAIDTHPKVAGFMRKVGLEDWIIRGGVSMDFIKGILDGSVSFEPQLDGMRKKLDDFMGRVMC